MSRVLPSRERWRLERQVTLGVILALTLQAAGALIWAGAAGERLTQLERRADLAQPLSERLARIEEKVGQSQSALARIEARLAEGRTEKECGRAGRAALGSPLIVKAMKV